jgi:para-aminobenzoate synthetase component 1
VGGQWRLWTPPVGNILPFLQQFATLQPPSPTIPDPSLPFVGGWLGWLGYDTAWEIEQLPWLRPDRLPFPVAYWYEPENFAVLDHWQQVLWIATTDPQQGDRLEAVLDQPMQSIHAPTFERSRYATTAKDYQSAVLNAKRYIQAGDVFQANLSLRFEVDGTAEPWHVYRILHDINPSPFSSYWQTPWGAVISCSPERLVHLSDRTAQTRPIAGTRPRSATPERDRQYEQELLSNAKENAEHIMLVDLERNDLGRVCQWGTVEVDELLTIERYSHVMHLVSNVRGKLQTEVDAIALIRALFPGGTITGCPKVRCMEIIEELEPVRRSLFYGSCGYLDSRGHLDLNILIRTLLAVPTEGDCKGHQPFHMIGQVGAGIVADSDPEREWEESLQKAKAQLAALGSSFHGS